MSELTTRKYFDNIYIPAGLIVFGCFITKREWTPYAVALALALAAYKFNAMREFGPSRNTSELPTDEPPHAEIKKVLKPDTFQDFELKEKTIISHNVAM